MIKEFWLWENRYLFGIRRIGVWGNLDCLWKKVYLLKVGFFGKEKNYVGMENMDYEKWGIE